MNTSGRFMADIPISPATRAVAQRGVTRFALFILAAAIMTSLTLLAGCSGQSEADANAGNPSTGAAGTADTGSAGTASAQTSSQQSNSPEASRKPATPEGADIVILLSDITETASFYPTTVGGVDLEVLAIKAPDGTVRTAFNTCQVCFSSGRGYYVQEGDNLVCQNCGNQFAASRVEIESGGCNPVPIFEGDKVTDGTTITIPADYLREAQSLFEDWKR
jgi:hypothetical protein